MAGALSESEERFCRQWVDDPNAAPDKTLLQREDVFQRIVEIKTERLYEGYRYLEITSLSPYANIYHCCTQKTASQWLLAVFSDPAVYQHTGLKVHPYARLGLRFARIDAPLPARTIGTHLYVDFATYENIPKPESYRTFFMLRDPRDVLVSWYFSARHSHVAVDPIPRLRLELAALSFDDGIKHLVETLEGWGSFAAQLSWVEAARQHADIRIFRYEDLARGHKKFLKELFGHLDIALPRGEFSALARRHAFAGHAAGRRRGDEDISSHYRKGVSGDWRNHFGAELRAYLHDRLGARIEALGYRV